MAKTTSLSKLNSTAMKPPRTQATMTATVGPWNMTHREPGGPHEQHA